MMKKFVLIAFVLLLGCVFAACQLDTAPRVIVKFSDPAGGNVIKDVAVEKGSSLGKKLPTNLTREGPYKLYGWFDGSSQYFSNTPIGADITLVARWSDDVATVTFAFTQTDNSGNVIEPTASIPAVIAIRGLPLGPLSLPTAPRAKGWAFASWLLDGEEFTDETPVEGNITLIAKWVAKKQFRVQFDTGPGGASIPDILVYENECIDEWEARFPPRPTVSANPKAFFVAWLDNENRYYDGRTLIKKDHLKNLDPKKNDPITARWGLPPRTLNLRLAADGGDIDSIGNGPGLDADVVEAWDSTAQNPKWVTVNQTTYDVPDNSGRWKILYRIKLDIQPEDGVAFNIGYYTKYTVRARFYANRQGCENWKVGGDADFKEGAFTPTKPAKASGYSADGLLVNAKYNPTDTGTTDYSPVEDGWGQISWVIDDYNGSASDANTMQQRYNLNRKGGTINDTFNFTAGQDLPYPPYLIVQTSDNFIGHIEIYEITFHNGVTYTEEELAADPTLAAKDEWVHISYPGEPKPKAGTDD